ncbi:MAG TPA: response regulator transcription factor [Chitinophagaceae bacterium]|nr:response regulator transcription factor [Chitinophagaceae bacterium]
MRILIADQLAIARKGLRQILLEEFPQVVVEEVIDLSDIIHKAPQGWDLFISDIAMPGYYGLELIHRLRRKCPGTPLLILSIYPDDYYAKRVLKAGVSGYLNKRASHDELVTAIKSILQGKRYIPPQMADQIVHDLLLESPQAPHETLSDREFDIFKMLVEGKTITEIAALLSLSGTMIGNYRNRIFAKMNIKSLAELILYASLHNLTG